MNVFIQTEQVGGQFLEKNLDKFMKKIKQVLVWRNDLKTRKGKMAAQIGHATLKAILDLMRKEGDTLVLDYKKYDGLEEWINNKFTKVCVQCNSEQELDDLYDKAKKANLICTMIVDEGLTEFNGVHTKTCIAIGPGPEDEINKITGHLSLM